MRAVDRDQILQMRAEGQSLEQIAKKLEIGYGTVRKAPGEVAETPREITREHLYIRYLAASVLMGGNL
jgi:DNA-directed RNA polymerase specialized sigma24 family protein